MRYTDGQKRAAIEMMTAQDKTHAAIARELGIGASTLRRCKQEHDAQTWADTVDVHFGFVRQYGFVVTEMDASTLWESTVVYRNGPAGILVSRDFEFDRVALSLVRAADVPLARTYLANDPGVTGSISDNTLLWMRATDPDTLLEQVDDLGLRDPAVATQLAFWANVLRTYGEDFLAGDLSVLDLPQPVIRRRK